MKGYFAFMGSEFYPEGGMNDFVGHFDSIEQAKMEMDRLKESDDYIGPINWKHIWDTRLNKEAWSD